MRAFPREARYRTGRIPHGRLDRGYHRRVLPRVVAVMGLLAGDVCSDSVVVLFHDICVCGYE